MCRINRHQRLSASLALVALTLTPQVFLAHGAGATPIPAQQAQTQAAPPGSLASPTTPETKAQIQLPPEQRGDLLFAQKHYQAAIEAYKNAPHDSAEIWNKMGIAYQLMFDNDDAIKCYLASLKLDPKNGSVLNNLGTIYASLKDYRNAEHYYRKSLQRDPNSAVVLKNLGTDLVVRGKFKQGGQYYAAAAAIDPHIFDTTPGIEIANPTTTANRGAMNYYMAKTCARAGMNGQAVEYLRMALNEGFVTPKKIMADSEFASLRGFPAFEQLLTVQGNP